MTGVDAEAKRTFLFAAINDTEGTIRATDTKASIALVLHGLFFSGLLAITANLGPVYNEAECGVKAAIAGLLVFIGLAFAASITQLLRCIRPAPASCLPGLPASMSQGHFFIVGRGDWFRGRAEMPASDQILDGIRALDEAKLEEELVSEHLKVSAIRARKTALISSGLLLLAVELSAAAIYLGLLGIEAG